MRRRILYVVLLAVLFLGCAYLLIRAQQNHILAVAGMAACAYGIWRQVRAMRGSKQAAAKRKTEAATKRVLGRNPRTGRYESRVVPAPQGSGAVAAGKPKGSVAPAARPQSAEPYRREDDLHRFKVAGVASGPDAAYRQDVLREILEAYERPKVRVELRETKFRDEVAISVHYEGKQVGFVPRTDIDTVLDIMRRERVVAKMTVYGGGEGKSYGARVNLDRA